MTDSHRFPLLVFAKPPVPGRVKTRLIEALGAEGAADVARALLQDCWAALAALRWARPVLVTEDPSFDHGVKGESWAQGQGPLGERLERALRRALTQHGAAAVIGADTAGPDPEALEALRRALAAGGASLGPADDGGFWVLGLDRCPPGLLADVPWSSPETARAVRARLERASLPVAELPAAFDVDLPADLDRFRARIPRPRAAFTHLALDRLGWPTGPRRG